MPNLQLVIAFAGTAAFLSFIAGVFGGVAFGMILLRMLLGAAAFGALGAGISLLIQRFMPELFSTGGAEESEGAAAGEESRQGSQVDIVLEDEEEAAPSYASAGGTDVDAAEEEDSFLEEVQSPQGETAAAEAAKAGTAESGAAGTGAETAGAGSEPAEEEGGAAQPAGEAPAAAAAGVGGSGRAQSEGGESDEFFGEAGDVDELPDLEDYADSFESVAAGGQSDGVDEYRGGGSSGSVDIDGEQQDPATVAKALRRFMKKDEEG